MTVRIKKIKYLIPPRDILNDALDVFVFLEDDYCTDGFCYFVEVTTPQFLSTIMKSEESAFLSPDYPCIIVSKLTDDIIRAAIESFINPKDSIDSDDELRWLKLYHVIPQLTIQEIDEILYRKKQEDIKFEAELDAEFEAESDTND
jgi:hypothetical protein